MDETEKKSSFKISTPIAVIIAGIIIGGAVIWSNNRSVPTTGGAPKAVAVDIKKVKTEGEPFIGNPNAKVTVAYWFDYQCPFCKKHEAEAMAPLVRDYVATGKVKIVYKDFAFLGNDSLTAALASHAVWDVAPQQFGGWHQAMLEKQDGENTGWGSKADILALTKSLIGASDTAKVEALMTEKAAEYQKAIDANKAEGISYGITGTPGLIIGKNLVVGAQSYDALKQLVEKAL